MDSETPIEEKAAAGEMAALLELGREALAGRSATRTPHDGAKLLLAAAEKGSADADCAISVIIAVDAKEPKDWSLALGYVQRAAERGSALARDQLCLLAADRDLAAAARADRCDERVWERLRDTVDITAKLKPPVLSTVFDSPRIRILEQFASEEECAWMIARGGARMGRAEVFDQQRGGGARDISRTNGAMMFGILDMDFVLALLRARIAEATRLPRASLEETNVLHYAPGQEFTRHFDFFDPTQEANAAEIAVKGQRVGTVLVYLNSGFEGAETDFPLLDWRYKGRPGDALFFLNVDDASKPDRQTMHAGLAPTRGEKWLLSQWIRGRPGVGL